MLIYFSIRSWEIYKKNLLTLQATSLKDAIELALVMETIHWCA